MDDRQKAAVLCVAATGSAVLLSYAAYELLRLATGQAIVAGSPLPAMTVLALACVVGFGLRNVTQA
jgi:hypothetical protein